MNIMNDSFLFLGFEDLGLVDIDLRLIDEEAVTTTFNLLVDENFEDDKMPRCPKI